MPMLTLDESRGCVTVCHADGTAEEHALGSPEAFEAVSAAWQRCGWEAKYVNAFTWMGRTVLQAPEKMIRIQELIWRLRPDVIVETGVAHGGSLIFYASLFEAMGNGRAVGIDIDIGKHNRASLESHPLAARITLVHGNSIALGTLAAVRHSIAPGECVLVVLDSNHSRAHVEAELDLYSSLVSPGSYIIASDGCMVEFAGAPRAAPDRAWNNPVVAVDAFLARNPDFVLEEPCVPSNEGAVRNRVTYWPQCCLRRR
jgi:cephalosporin hydroxylase